MTPPPAVRCAFAGGCYGPLWQRKQWTLCQYHLEVMMTETKGSWSKLAPSEVEKENP